MLDVVIGSHWHTFVTKTPVEGVKAVMKGGFGEPETIGGYGHPRSIAHESGSRVYFGSPRPGQPVCVNVPGEACETWAADALGWCQDLSGATTRYDVALDLGPPELARKRLVQGVSAWKQRKVETQIRRGSHKLFISDKAGDGWTAYYGGSQAHYQLRVYDRRGPLRLEFQIRPTDDLKPMFAKLVQTAGAAAIWRSYALRIKFPMPWYQELLEGDAAEWSSSRSSSTEFLEVFDQIEKQYGPALWMLGMLGMNLNDLCRHPMSLHRDQRAKGLRWARQADEAGYDGSALRRAIEGEDHVG